MSDGERDRFRRERDTADRAYGDALTAVDRVLPHAPASAPAAPGLPPYDGGLESRTRILPAAPPEARGWRGRLARFVWRLVAPTLTRQQELNEALVSQMRQQHAALREACAAVEQATAASTHYMQELMTFNSTLVQCLQRIPPFVDTKIRMLDAGLDEARMAATAAQRSALAARHAIDRFSADDTAIHTASSPLAPQGAPPVPAHPSSSLGPAYVGFEDLYRGSSGDIRRRQAEYVERFAGASNVLDVGCGRGEFLELLRDAGIDAHGIDMNPEMVQVCRDRGLRAEHAEALGYLDRLADASLGGLVALQVVEHLEPEDLMRLLETAARKLRPGATILLETINAACWVAFFEAYIRDITHVRPLHPDTLTFLVVAAGFEQVDVLFRSPVDETGRLQHAALADAPAGIVELVRTINANTDRLNERLFTYLDFAVVAVKGV